MIINSLENGKYKIGISEKESDLISLVSTEIKSSLQAEKETGGTSRLFPPAYLGQPDAESEYHEMVLDDLFSSHTSALENLNTSLLKLEVTEFELMEMMRALNILRLSLAEHLNISDDDKEEPSETDPSYGTWIIFQIFGQMLTSIVDSLQDNI